MFDPKGKAKSVALTDEGLKMAEELFRKHFVKKDEGSAATRDTAISTEGSET
jgi:hypothetical protein